jgi:predicted phosphodiesterase
MRVLVISDIHSNLSALEAVLDSAGRYDTVWCLGDLVGYGPDPNECIAKVRTLPNLVCVRGNHDAATLGEMDQQTFNHEASLAITWTKHVIDAASKEFLLELPEKQVVGEITLVHGSPRNPVWEYVMDYVTALQCFPYFETSLCLVGHTHVPALWQQNPGENPAIVHDYLKMNISGRSILNPGSVGQPRDRDRRASFALFDPDSSTWELRRVEYDIASVQQRIQKAGLPWRHALRLNMGW